MLLGQSTFKKVLYKFQALLVLMTTMMMTLLQSYVIRSSHFLQPSRVTLPFYTSNSNSVTTFCYSFPHPGGLTEECICVTQLHSLAHFSSM